MTYTPAVHAVDKVDPSTTVCKLSIAEGLRNSKRSRALLTTTEPEDVTCKICITFMGRQ